MTEDEFEQFSKQLPEAYQVRFARMGTFSKLARNKDVILLEDFEQTLDIFAEMQAKDCDIDFEIHSTKRKRKHAPSISLQRKRQPISEKDDNHIFRNLYRMKIDEIQEDSVDNIYIEIIYQKKKVIMNYNYHKQGRSNGDDNRIYDVDLLTYQNQIIIQEDLFQDKNLKIMQ